jgi:hypothetical protein
MIKVYCVVGSYEGEGFSSVHLTRKGALADAIEDIWDFLAADGSETFEDEGGNPCFHGSRAELFVMSSDELSGVLRAWQEPLWARATGQYSIDVHEQRICP